MKLGVFKVNQLGDAVVFLPVLQTLRRLYPQWELVLFTSPAAAELFGPELGLAALHTMPTAEFNGAYRQPATLLRLWRTVARARLDASLLADDQGNVAHLLAFLAGGRVRVGVRPPFIKMRGGLTDIITLSPGVSVPEGNWEIARALVRRLGGTDWPERPPAPDLASFHHDTPRVAGRVIIHSGASREYKRWPPERYIELANRLAPGRDVIWIEQPHTAAEGLDPAVRRVAPASLREFITLLRSALLLVGNNSGPMHLASAVGCPAVIMNGPSHLVWDPIWNRDRFILLRDTSLPCAPCDPLGTPLGFCGNVAAPYACMRSWSVDTVHAEALRWLERWTPVLSGM